MQSLMQLLNLQGASIVVTVLIYSLLMLLVWIVPSWYIKPALSVFILVLLTGTMQELDSSNDRELQLNKLNSWTLTVEEDKTTGDAMLTFPQDLLEVTGWKEGDTLTWKDNGDGSWSLEKKD